DDLHTLPAPAVPVDEKGFRFTDIQPIDWFYSNVRELASDGIIKGMTRTTFAPNGTLTYGQALKLIGMAVGEKEPTKSGAHWASGWLTLAKSKGWLASDVNLDGSITRLALCQIAAKAKGLTEQPAKYPFKDTNDKDFLALNKAKVIDGMTKTEFKPNELLTRAQIAKIICALRDLTEAPEVPEVSTSTAFD
ncbi:MAG: S-layer homology domain-containing protein, partial [Oscillospiraceae bacterium]|nr:S-layer homology domain-containing protein [Oscillospiraceae bacterium]